MWKVSKYLSRSSCYQEFEQATVILLDFIWMHLNYVIGDVTLPLRFIMKQDKVGEARF